MSDEFESYAVYWVPKQPDSLAKFGVAWTGWCAERGEFRPRNVRPYVSADIAAITRDSWRHGFHGVIRAPFRLRAGAGSFALEHALEIIAEECVGVPLPQLRLAVVGNRVALLPSEPSAALGALLARASAAMAGIGARANGATLPHEAVRDRTGQVVQLPAGDGCRFHAPLTDLLPLGTAFEVMERLRPTLAPILGEPRCLDEIALMGDPGEGRPLRLLQSYELRRTPPRRATVALPCRGPHILAPMFDHAIVERDIAI